jgi:hypothetical protein
VPRDLVPAVPERTVVYVDGYGNLKTGWREAPGHAGERLLVRIGDVASVAVVSDGTFEVPEGELSFAPGSSGWRTRSGERREVFELLLRGGSAARRFGGPPTGAPVVVDRSVG